MQKPRFQWFDMQKGVAWMPREGGRCRLWMILREVENDQRSIGEVIRQDMIQL